MSENKTGSPTTKKASPTTDPIYTLLSTVESGVTTVPEIAKQLGKHRTTIHEHVNKAIKKGLLLKIGKSPMVLNITGLGHKKLKSYVGEANAGDTKTKNSTSNSKFKQVSSSRRIYGHNVSWKFPLADDCKIPFKEGWDNFTKLPRGKFNVRYDFNLKKAFVRQTNKHLIVFPKLESASALPSEAIVLQGRLFKKADAVVKELLKKHSGLLIKAPLWKPSTQEYAIKDGFAKALCATEGFSTFENEIAKIDASVHLEEESGFINSLGEIDWKHPAFADAYIRMPFTFMRAMKMFESQMKSHVGAIKKIGVAAEAQVKATNELRLAVKPKKRRFSTRFDNSATFRGVT